MYSKVLTLSLAIKLSIVYFERKGHDVSKILYLKEKKESIKIIDFHKSIILVEFFIKQYYPKFECKLEVRESLIMTLDIYLKLLNDLYLKVKADEVKN